MRTQQICYSLQCQPRIHVLHVHKRVDTLTFSVVAEEEKERERGGGGRIREIKRPTPSTNNANKIDIHLRLCVFEMFFVTGQWCATLDRIGWLAYDTHEATTSIVIRAQHVLIKLPFRPSKVSHWFGYRFDVVKCWTFSVGRNSQSNYSLQCAHI